ncbi:hypothetical protein CcaCcLH18_14092 [Colletotrichum camelliae]|nr:hypothetical protein CcaCcLH18_14092 [Colletotrichum camelliae]
MSYQYPPPLSTPEVDISRPGHADGHAPGYSAPAPGPPMNVPISHDQSIKGREEVFPQASLEWKRSTTKHNVRPWQANIPYPDQAALANNKRNNKLGYHRNSVACGHCRRRKIRCIPVPTDTLGRCSNCIRLKKECAFHPVDQPPAPQSTEARPKAPSPALTGTMATSASASPAMTPSQSPYMSQYHQYEHVAMPSVSIFSPPMRPTGVEGSQLEDLGESWRDTNSSTAPSGAPLSSHPISHDTALGAAKPSELNELSASCPQKFSYTPSLWTYSPRGPGLACWEAAINTDPNVPEDTSWVSFEPVRSVCCTDQAQPPSQYWTPSWTMDMDLYSTQITTLVPGFDAEGGGLYGVVPHTGDGW